MLDTIAEMIEEGNLEWLRDLLDRDPEYLTVLIDGDQPIHLAAETGSVEMTSFFLDRGSFIDSQGFNHRTALHIALQNQDYPLAQMLLSRGARPDIPDSAGSTAYKKAAENAVDREEMAFFRHLVEEDERLDLNGALAGGLFDRVLKILGSDPSAAVRESPAPDKLIEDLVNGYERLGRVAHPEEIDLIDVLLDAGATIADQHGVGALYYACQGENLAAVERLLKRGADPHYAEERNLGERQSLLELSENSQKAEEMKALLCRYGAKNPKGEQVDFEEIEEAEIVEVAPSPDSQEDEDQLPDNHDQFESPSIAEESSAEEIIENTPELELPVPLSVSNDETEATETESVPEIQTAPELEESQLDPTVISNLLRSSNAAELCEGCRRVRLSRQGRFATNLRRLLGHSSPDVREKAALGLGAIAGPSMVFYLERLSDDPETAVRVASAHAIAEIESR